MKILKRSALLASLVFASCDSADEDVVIEEAPMAVESPAAEVPAVATEVNANEEGCFFEVELAEGDYAGEKIRAKVTSEVGSALLSLRYEEELVIGEIVIDTEKLENRNSRGRLTLNFHGDPEVGEMETFLNKNGSKVSGWCGQLVMTPNEPSDEDRGHTIDFKEMTLEFTAIGEWTAAPAEGDEEGRESRDVSGRAVVSEQWQRKWGKDRTVELTKPEGSGTVTFTVKQFRSDQ